LGAIRRITAAAERASITLAIENHADVTAEQLLWIINEVSSERLRVCFDTVNAVRVGDDLQRAAEALAPYAVACHAKDIDSQPWHPLSGPTSTPLGDGVLPVEEAVRLIARASPECRFLVELAHLGPGDVDEQALIVEDLGWLRSTLHRED
jgi:sugar phosphate isomerase/epimerase